MVYNGNKKRVYCGPRCLYAARCSAKAFEAYYKQGGAFYE